MIIGDYFKSVITVLITCIFSYSCSTVEKSYSKMDEDQLLVTRKYVGDYIEYRRTNPDDFKGYNLIWISTTQDTIYGKISAFGKKCRFSPGDRLFLKRTYLAPGGISGYWIYRIENDSNVRYRLTGYQHDRKVPLQDWF